MPKWITNKLKAATAVIEAAVNEEGHFDFSKTTPSPCPVGGDWDEIYPDAEIAAKAVTDKPLSSHPFLRSFEARNRAGNPPVKPAS